VKSFLLFLSALAVVVSSALPCHAKDDAAESASKPVAVLSIASYERLMVDLKFLGNLMGTPDLDQNLEGMIQLFTQGQGFAGLDKKRPLGLTLTTDGLQFQPILVLPVSNLKQLLEALEGIVGQAQDAGNGVFELDIFSQKFYVREVAGYSFWGQSPEALADLPKDGAALFGGLDKSYDIAGRLYVQNVPPVFRSLIVDQLKMGVETGLARQPSETDESYGKRKKLVEDQLATLTKIINDVDQLTLGMALNAEAKSAYLDIGVTAMPGTPTAKQLAQVRNTKSNFGGFISPEAAASVNVSATLAPDNTPTIVAALQAFRTQVMERIETGTRLQDENVKKLTKVLIGHVFDAVRTTFETGTIDGGATLNLSDKSLSFIAGAYVAQPKALEDAIRQFGKDMQGQPGFPGIKFDAATHAGVRFHTTSIPVPAEDPLAKVLGPSLDVAIGIGEKSAYLAVGSNSLAQLKEAIDKSKLEAGKEVPPARMEIALASIFQFAAAVQNDPEVTANAQELAKAKGKDHIHVVVTPQPTGINIRLEGQEGVLQLLGNALKTATAAGGLPGFGP